MADNFKECKTGISTVFERTKTDDLEVFKAILVKDEKKKNAKKTISWFDDLFRGGIRLYEGKTTTMLIKGPPGSGKSTLASELCYRLGLSKNFFKSLYISFESDSERIYSNIVNSFGWDSQDNHQIAILKDKIKGDEFSFSFIKKKKGNANEFEEHRTAEDTHFGIWSPTDKSKDKIKFAIETAIAAIEIILAATINVHIPIPEGIKGQVRKWIKKQPFKKYNNMFNPNVIVIDSLNIIEEKDQGATFEYFLETAKKEGIKLLIFILDNNSAEIKNPLWDYYCDIILEMNHENNNDYYYRTFEIVKARYQEHVWGKHQLKIFPKKIREFEEVGNEEINQAQKMLHEMRIHPFRNEGGIFIFPSIHYYLSNYKRKVARNAPSYDITYPKALNDILVSLEEKDNKGFPKGRCTAFIGCRGGHKSHLAYLHLIKKLEASEMALIISLRDDEEMTVNTMKHIVDKEYDKNDSKKINIHECIESGKLEILYYIPGYISPEEFIHRIYVSIKKLRNLSPKPITVMFNSLDQLNARFPLCAKKEIFIPSIIQILIGEEITGIFIAVDEKDQPNSQFGLLPMADLILSFHKYRMEHKTYVNAMNGDSNYDINLLNKEKEKKGNREEVIVTVERHAGGQKAGAKGILELENCMRVDEKTDRGNFIKKTGCVNFIKISDEFDFNKIIKIE